MLDYDNSTLFVNAFTIDLACSLAVRCCFINECPMEYAPCPFGYDGQDSKLCTKVTPSMWAKVLKERVG